MLQILNKYKYYLVSFIIFVILIIVILNIVNSRDNSTNSKGGLTLTLLGGSSVTTSLNSDFIDPGYIAVDINSGNVTKSVKIIDNIDLTNEGTYYRTYTATNDRGVVVSAKRIIIVKKNSDNIIALKGNKVVSISLNDKYVEEGYIVDDNISVNTTNDIDTTKEGIYTVTYSTVINGVKYYQYRTVVVVNDVEDIHLSVDSSVLNNTISLFITGDNYKYTLLPNGSKSYLENINYSVVDKGLYTFYVVNTNGKMISKTIDVL